ncbi:MAG: flippase-like domain-containing protein [Lawsonibacter sp.]|nr:flippase-like domain-containing protein [Lawsonibacter sp.]
MMERKNWLGLLFLAVMMAITGCVLLRGQSMPLLWAGLRKLNPAFVLLGLALMVGYVSCEALCTRQILGRLGHPVPYRRCLGYSFVGFYVSSITPSATGGQPAQVYYMSRDQIPAAHGALNMMLIASCYQVAALLWGGAMWLVPSVRALAGSQLGLLLIYGATVMTLLTLGMMGIMFLPAPARRICQRILRLLTATGLVKNPSSAQEKLDRQLAEYARGAACVRANPGLTLQVLGLCILQLGLLFSVPWVVYLAFGFSGQSWLQVVGVQALVTLAVCNLPLPGAVGPAEGSFVSAFAPVFGASMVTPAMLISRGISFYAFLVISCAVAVCVHLRTSRESRVRTLQALAAHQRGARGQTVRRYLSTRATG